LEFLKDFSALLGRAFLYNFADSFGKSDPLLLENFTRDLSLDKQLVPLNFESLRIRLGGRLSALCINQRIFVIILYKTFQMLTYNDLVFLSE